MAGWRVGLVGVLFVLLLVVLCFAVGGWDGVGWERWGWSVCWVAMAGCGGCVRMLLDCG